MMSELPISLLVLGAGNMGRKHAKAFSSMKGVRVVAAADPEQSNLHDLGELYGVEHFFDGIRNAIAWGEFDACANVTPDSLHFSTTMSLLDAGKHVLCEKPLATNYRHAREMAEKAGNAGLVNMINLTFRKEGVLEKARQMVSRGDIGELRHFEASYLQSWLTQNRWGDWRDDPQWLWKLSTSHGSSGALGDLGVHIFDLLTFVAGSDIESLSCRLHTFPKNGNEHASFTLDANDSFVVTAALECGAAGVIHSTRFASGHINDLRLRIYGTRGGLDVAIIDHKGTLRACLGDDLSSGVWVEVEPLRVDDTYTSFTKEIRTGVPMGPDFRHGAKLQNVVEQAFASDRRRGARMTISGL